MQSSFKLKWINLTKNWITEIKMVVMRKDLLAVMAPLQKLFCWATKTDITKCNSDVMYWCNSDVTKIDWSPVYNATDVGLVVQYFPSSFQLVFETHATYIEKRVKSRPCPWLDIDTKKLMNRRDQTLRKARKPRFNDDWRNKCNKKSKTAKSNHHKKALNDNMNKPNKFWSQIKNVFPGKSQSMTNVSTD